MKFISILNKNEAFLILPIKFYDFSFMGILKKNKLSLPKK